MVSMVLVLVSPHKNYFLKELDHPTHIKV
jgi:hypothetical protein